jgi:hypothetical protein
MREAQYANTKDMNSDWLMIVCKLVKLIRTLTLESRSAFMVPPVKVISLSFLSIIPY